MGFKMKYTIKADYIKKGKRRSGRSIKPSFGVCHDTGNAGSTAQNNRDYYNNTYMDPSCASAQTFVDDIDILECIPLTTAAPEQAFHVLYNRTLDNQLFGDDANDIAAGVELCFGENKKTGRVINFEEAYKRYVWYMAYVSYKFGFTPNRWIGHEKLDPKRKTDPSNALERYGKTYEQLMADIVKEYNECIGISIDPIPVAPVTKPETKVTSTLLKEGSKGKAVSDLQAKLNKVGYKLEVDGIFGKGTENAVFDFQKKQDIGMDGVVGSQTIAALDKAIVALSKPKPKKPSRSFARTYRYTTPMMSDSNFRSTDIAAIQKLTGAKVDGYFGKATEEKVKDWQKDHGLSVDGIVGPKTFAAMFK